MRAMVLERQGKPLTLIERSDPEPADGEVRIQVSACGVCRTDLHVVDGESLTPSFLSFLGMRSLAALIWLGEGLICLRPVCASGSLGSVKPAGIALIVAAVAKIFAMPLSLPAIRATAVTRRMSSPTHDMCFACQTLATMWRRHRCSVLD